MATLKNTTFDVMAKHKQMCLVDIYRKLVSHTFVSGENSNAPLFTRCVYVIDLTPGIGSEEDVNTILTFMEISTSFVRV